jgi:exodeoxyribonuclease V gamma subunit
MAARAMQGIKDEKETVETPICSEETLEKTISLTELRRFYRDPARYFLENRLEMKLPDKLWFQNEENEPFAIDPLSTYLLKQELVEGYLTSGDQQNLLKLKRAEGVLPVGCAGNYSFDALSLEAGEFAESVAQYLQSPPLEDMPVKLSRDKFHLTGTLENIRAAYRISYRMAELNMKDYLDAWIAHVILNAAAPEGYPQTSLISGKESHWCFEPLTNADEQLNCLIQYFLLGQTRPLKFFARSSWEYASALWRKNKTRKEALTAAHLAWQKDEGGRAQSDSEEIACKLCFEDVDPIDEEFEKTAEAILKDLLVHMRKCGADHDVI